MDDRNSIIGIFLILAIVMLLPTYWEWLGGGAQQPPESGEVRELPQPEEEPAVAPQGSAVDLSQVTDIVRDSLELSSDLVMEELQSAAPTSKITIQTPLIGVDFSNANGGRFTRWELNKYHYFADGQVNLITPDNGFNLEFTDASGKLLQLNSFSLLSDDMESGTIVLDEGNPIYQVEMYLPLGAGRIVKAYTFYYDKYAVDIAIRLENVQERIQNRYYTVTWDNGLPFIEENRQEEAAYMIATLSRSGSAENFSDVEDVEVKQSFTGDFDWVSVRNKYFTAAILPDSSIKTENLLITGRAYDAGNEVIGKSYTTFLDIPYSRTSSHEDHFTLFAGPINYGVLSAYHSNLQDMVLNTSGYEWFFRLFSIYLILPAFKFLHTIIPNYGLVIIVFSVLVKVVLHPLTKKSYESTSKMQALRPMMEEIQAKYKSDPQQLQRATMKMYKEQGVNPLGGCIPMVLQMPLLISLFIVFRSTIQLRGEPFVAWITDLSLPDKLMTLPFEIPFLGDYLSILPLVMGVSMLVQSSMTITDPKQKALVYMMPVMMTFFFYSFPSGLNLYYTMFNLLTMAQTHYIKKHMQPIIASSSAAQKPLPSKTDAVSRPAKPAVQRKKKNQK